MGKRKTASRRRLRTEGAAEEHPSQDPLLSKEVAESITRLASSPSCLQRSTPSMLARNDAGNRITWNHFLFLAGLALPETAPTLAGRLGDCSAGHVQDRIRIFGLLFQFFNCLDGRQNR
jgi:hypothetical protein